MGRPPEVGMTGERRQRMINDGIVDLGSAWSSHKTNEILEMANRLYEGKDLEAHFAGEIESFDGNVWAWVQARIRAGDFQGINVGDFIRFVAGGHTVVAEIAGINTYRRGGLPEIGNHVDFISRDCWHETVKWNLANFNNGIATMTCPYLTSNVHAFINSLQMDVPNDTVADPATIVVDYRGGGILSRLPAELKDAIVPKATVIEHRYMRGVLLEDSNSWDRHEIGPLWLPSEIEIFGSARWGTVTSGNQGRSQACSVQYPLFALNLTRSIKGDGRGRPRTYWWLRTVYGGLPRRAAIVGHDGRATNNNTTMNLFVPVCFRIA